MEKNGTSYCTMTSKSPQFFLLSAPAPDPFDFETTPFKIFSKKCNFFKLHFFVDLGTLRGIRLFFLKYCLTVATAMMSLKKAAAAFL